MNTSAWLERYDLTAWNNNEKKDQIVDICRTLNSATQNVVVSTMQWKNTSCVLCCTDLIKKGLIPHMHFFICNFSSAYSLIGHLPWQTVERHNCLMILDSCWSKLQLQINSVLPFVFFHKPFYLVQFMTGIIGYCWKP